jgi:AP2-associated kinase
MYIDCLIQKSLSGHPSIVQFIDFCFQMLPNDSGYELLILMEHCPGGHLVDYLNSRLNNRPQELEILSIFSQICEGVAYMHSQDPLIAHRDLKVENVLLSNGIFKLCDFGSCTSVIVPSNSPLPIQEIRKIEDEISRLTTLQYRAPEMCDLYQKRGLNEKVDIWALGVLLYKLCYYTTPFENSGKMGILSGIFDIPVVPHFSDSLKSLISLMLQLNADTRPDIYQVFDLVCKMRRVSYPLKIVFDY